MIACPLVYLLMSLSACLPPACLPRGLLACLPAHFPPSAGACVCSVRAAHNRSGLTPFSLQGAQSSVTTVCELLADLVDFIDIRHTLLQRLRVTYHSKLTLFHMTFSCDAGGNYLFMTSSRRWLALCVFKIYFMPTSSHDLFPDNPMHHDIQRDTIANKNPIVNSMMMETFARNALRKP